MTELETLHRYVLDNPAEDACRLVYADRLDETGRPWDAARAAFIRAQFAGRGDVSNGLLKKWGGKWLPKSVRQRMAVHGAGFAVDAGAILLNHVVCPTTFTFTRGFISVVRVTVGTPSVLSDVRVPPTVRQFFATAPVELVRLVVDGWEPEIDLVLRRTDAVWFVQLHWLNAVRLSAGFDSRRDALAFLPGFLAAELSLIEFDPGPVDIPF